MERRASITRASIHAETAAQYPRLAARRRPRGDSAPIDPTAIVLGGNERGAPVLLPVRPRLEHAHVIGTTGGGKTTLLEHCIRQDILAGRGVCVIDPHGNHPVSLYRKLLVWLEQKELTKKRVVHLVDPNAPTHTVGFNPLAVPDENTDLSVIAGVTLEAFEQVWGEDSQNKPTIRRVLLATFTALAELGLTLAESDLLFDPDDEQGVRRHVIRTVQDRFARRVFRRLQQLAEDRSKRDFNAEVVGPENRLAEFLRSAGVRSILGQTTNTLDLRAAMDEGDVILVNLAGGRRVYEADAALLGRLVTRFLFFHALRRHHPERPFFFYLDECQRYLSGDVERLLAESRKFGVGCVLSHQWQTQLRNGEDETTLQAVQNATNLKTVFRVKSVKEASELAEAVIPLDLERPVEVLSKPTVVGNRRTTFRSRATAIHEAHSHGEAIGISESESATFTRSEGISSGGSEGESVGDMAAMAAGTSHLSGTATGHSAGSVMMPNSPFLAPPDVLTISTGDNAVQQVASGSSTNAMTGSSQNRSRARSTSRSSSESRGTSSGWSRSFVTSDAEMQGRSEIEGVTEGLEPIFEVLPSAVHSRDNMLYLAAQQLRSLKTGQAFINYVGPEGMVAAMLAVPKVQSLALDEAEFTALRSRVLAQSPSATESGHAAQEIKNREQQLIAEAQASQRPPAEPSTFRVPAPKRKTTSSRKGK